MEMFQSWSPNIGYENFDSNYTIFVAKSSCNMFVKTGRSFNFNESIIRKRFYGINFVKKLVKWFTYELSVVNKSGRVTIANFFLLHTQRKWDFYWLEQFSPLWTMGWGWNT